MPFPRRSENPSLKVLQVHSINIILPKMSDFALRADLKETTFALLFKYSSKLFHRIESRYEKEDQKIHSYGVVPSFVLSLWFLKNECYGVNREFVELYASSSCKCMIMASLIFFSGFFFPVA